MTSDAESPDGQPAPRRTAATSRGSCTYFGVGNENWGCGGNMRPEYYADQYRRYSTYVQQLRRQPHLPASPAAPNGGDYNWTEVLMSEAGRQMDGLSLHYYTVPTGNWERQGLGHRVRRGPSGTPRCSRTLRHGRTSSRSTPPSWTSTTRRSASA